MRGARRWIVLVHGACSLALGQARPILLGVLEDAPGRFAGEPHSRCVRVVFRRDGGEWSAFPSDCADTGCLESIAARYPRQVSWTVGFDGRAIGHVTTESRPFQSYAEIGQQRIAGGSAIPTIGKPSMAYAGWLGEAVYRPLIVSSNSYFSDPEAWKPSEAPGAVVREVRRRFRERYPKLVDCDAPERPKPSGDADIRPVKAYASNRGWRLVEVAAKACAAGEDRGALASEWFVVNPAGEASYLAGNMWLVDAGDYDQDGNAEVVFAVDDYNRGGYRLYFADFRKSAAFEFSYH